MSVERERLPKGWRCLPFENAVTRVSVQTRKLKVSEYQQSGRYPIIDQGQQDVVGYTDDASCVFNQPLPIIIFGDHTQIVKYIDYPFAIGADGVVLLSANPGIDSRFLFYWLEQEELRYLGYARHYGVLKDKTVIFPSWPEQQRIVAILREQMAAVEQARKAAQERYDASASVLAALLRRVFPQDEKELPDGWRIVPLGDLIESSQPGFACGLRDPDGVIQVRMNNVDTQGNFVWGDVLRVPANYIDMSQFELKRGDVLFNNTNSTYLVGKSALFQEYDEPAVFSNHFTRLRTKSNELQPAFLSAWLNHQWSRGVFAKICNSWIGQSAVKADILMKQRIPLPSLFEQQRLTAILCEHRGFTWKVASGAEEGLDTINALPAALLRRAFNGEL